MSSIPVTTPGACLVDYEAHPFLDPHLFERDRYVARYFARIFREYTRNDWQYSRLLNRLLRPVGEEQPAEVNERVLASYLADATTYVRELLALLPPASQQDFATDPLVDECNDLMRLAKMIFKPGQGDAQSRRRRQFEAQRKLYLAKLLIHIENTRMVQDGPRHRHYLQELLDKELWSFVRDRWAWTGWFDQAAPERGVVNVPGPRGKLEGWEFDVRKVVRDMPGGAYDVDVYHFDTRFKKETAGYEYQPGQSTYEVTERTRYGDMKRNRSASILSKMLRKGINDPTAITDMLGAKFIVSGDHAVHQLADLLHQVLGGPFLFRNQVDLFRRPQDHHRLNPQSSRRFCAFKEDVDILFPSHASKRDRPYFFAVELQILTVDGFLRTVHSQDYASHGEYKRRQFLEGVVPYVFPEELYGRVELVVG